MHSSSPLRPTSGVLIGAAVLALIVGWAFYRSQDAREDLAIEPGTTGVAESADPESTQGEKPPDESRIDARASLPLGQPPESEAAVDPVALSLRFVRGSTGATVPGLAVRIFEVASDQASELAPDARLLAEGRTNAHGLLFVPASLRAQRFAIDVESDDGLARSTIPNFFEPEILPAAGSVIEVQVFGAWAAFEALVLDQRGQPIADATVQFDFESPAFAFSTHDAPSTRVNSNSEGLARIELVDPASAGGRLRIKAEFAADLHSETIELAPPLKSARVELRLSTSASAIVRASSAKGSPLAGAMARVEQIDAPFTSVGRSTDRDGAAKFLPLEPGRYVASVEDPSTHASTREEFSVGRCQMADVHLTLPACNLPLALAGSVRDADGKPLTWLWVSICVEGREEARLALDRDGRFEYHRAPCERLRVRVQASFDGPVIDPEIVDATFGTEDLVFVLRDAPRMGFTALRVIDRESGLALSGVAAAVFRDSAAERIGGVLSVLAGSALSLASNEDGLLFVPSGPQLPRAQLIVEKRGYARREFDLSDLSSLPVRDGRPTLELARGYVHRWVVLDARTGAPVAGAIATHGIDPFTGLSIEDGSTWLPSAPSDARGVLELSLPQAPGRVSIQARGYRPRAVDAGSPIQVIGAALSLGDAVLLESAAQR